MHSRKRQASISLQAGHHTKQPRLEITRPDGTPSGPTHSIPKRWLQVGKDIVSVTLDTIVMVLHIPFSSTSPEPDSPVQAYTPSSSSSPSPTPTPASQPLQTTSTDSLTASRRTRSKDPPKNFVQQDPFSADAASLQLENLTLTPSTALPTSQNVPIHNPSTPSATTSSQPVSQQSSILNFSFASTGSSQTTASPPANQQQHLSSSPPSKRKRKTTSRKDPHIRTEHIFHRTYKMNLEARKAIVRKDINKQANAIKQKQSLSTSERDPSSYSEYEKLVRTIRAEQRLTDLLHRLGPKQDNLKVPLAPPEVQRILEAAPDQPEFLHRYLERAKSTLNSPRPPKPYIPAIEELEVRRKKKVAELDSRLAIPSIPSALPPVDDQEVTSLLKKRGVISKFAREQVSDTDLRRLGPGQWLNDELINFYGALILSKSEALLQEAKAKKGKALDIHYFSTFFWSKLVNEGYEKGRLAKWTKKIDIFAKDVILIPVNHNNAHWTAAAINFKQKRLESYDSMATLDQGVFKVLKSYVEAESLNKKKKPFDWDGWVDWAPETTPQQENGFDCGVFTCQILRAVSRGDEEFAFSQKDMPYLRRRMIWEIGHAKLRDGYT
ncbi:hypothetical protein CVT24_004756 [Panaeolus cyanescens]|uniref:Ubiquitin-like protease family profile domain-containing protein n=1 Tax=Panaeolus cyanescens TaxID=181874 RepID=A0A409V9U4_9AGAR|nr:hypothetical protein CVT24_004756 [Panaeolus cyanescens]